MRSPPDQRRIHTQRAHEPAIPLTFDKRFVRIRCEFRLELRVLGRIWTRGTSWLHSCRYRCEKLGEAVHRLKHRSVATLNSKFMLRILTGGRKSKGSVTLVVLGRALVIGW
jgi:hypothetical protein